MTNRGGDTPKPNWGTLVEEVDIERSNEFMQQYMAHSSKIRKEEEDRKREELAHFTKTNLTSKQRRQLALREQEKEFLAKPTSMLISDSVAASLGISSATAATGKKPKQHQHAQQKQEQQNNASSTGSRLKNMKALIAKQKLRDK